MVVGYVAWIVLALPATTTTMAHIDYEPVVNTSIPGKKGDEPKVSQLTLRQIIQRIVKMPAFFVHGRSGSLWWNTLGYDDLSAVAHELGRICEASNRHDSIMVRWRSRRLHGKPMGNYRPCLVGLCKCPGWNSILWTLLVCDRLFLGTPLDQCL